MSSITAAFQALIAPFSPFCRNQAVGQEEQVAATLTATAIELAAVMKTEEVTMAATNAAATLANGAATVANAAVTVAMAAVTCQPNLLG